LVIKKSKDVPFYVTKSYQSVNPFQIYTRVGDTNTPINSEADISDVERLWKIRFGLIPNPVERAREYIKDKENWQEEKDTWNSRGWYYTLFPEFRITQEDNPEEENLRNPPYTAIHTNAWSSWRNIKVKYHQTVLYEFYAHYLDETRGIAISPLYTHLKSGFGYDESEFRMLYYFYFEGCMEMNISNFLNYFLPSDEYAWRRHLDYVVVYVDEKEKNDFEKYLKNNWDNFEKQLPEFFSKITLGGGHGLDERDQLFARQDMTVPAAVSHWFEKYRNDKLFNL